MGKGRGYCCSGLFQGSSNYGSSNYETSPWLFIIPVLVGVCILICYILYKTSEPSSETSEEISSVVPPLPSAPNQSENMPNTTEARMDRLSNQMVFQQVLSAVSVTEEIETKTKESNELKKKSKKKKKRSANVDHDSDTTSERNYSISSDNESNAENKSKNSRNSKVGTSDDVEMGTLRYASLRDSTLPDSSSLRLLVFSGNADGIDDDDIDISKKAIKSQTLCSICLEPYRIGDVVVRMKGSNSNEICNHCFHEACILKWLEEHDDCPLCRLGFLGPGRMNE